MESRRGNAPWLLPLLLGAGSLLGAAALSLAPLARGPVAALFPPWWSGTRAMLAASAVGPVVRFGLPFVIIVVPQGDHPARALRQAGAWAVLNPQAFGGCGGQKQTGE